MYFEIVFYILLGMNPPSLDWVHLLTTCIHSASGNIKSYSISPIKDFSSLIDISLSEGFTDKDEPLVRTLINAFTSANECKVKSIQFSKDKVHVPIFAKYKHGPVKDNDPLTRKIRLLGKKTSNAHQR